MFPCDWSPIEMMMWLRVFTGGSGGEETIVSGVSPLSLTNALAKNIVSLTQYGLCTQASTPTPSSPVDIKCNNGAIKAKHQSGLPLGYQKLDYIVGKTGQTVVDTGVAGDLANLRIVCRAKKTSHSAYSPFFGNYKDENTNCTRIIEGSSETSAVLFTYNGKAGGGSSSASDILSADAHTYDLSSFGLVVDGDKSFANRGVSGTSNSTKIAICSSNVPVSAAQGGVNTVFAYFKIYQGETLIRDYVPVERMSDNKVGFYELVNNTFEAGIFASSYAFIAGSPVNDPVEFYADGTPEVLSVTAIGKTPQTASVANLLAVGDYKDEQDIISGLLTHKVGIKVFDGTENWELHASASGTYRLDGVFTDLAQGVPILSSLLCTNLSATDALATADFTPGMARWSGSSVGTVVVTTSGTRLYACFGLSTVQEVKAFLSAQYAAGTPVIVLYPLADETTETVTPQPLNTTEGTNTVTATAEVSPIQLSVVYMAKSE